MKAAVNTHNTKNIADAKYENTGKSKILTLWLTKSEAASMIDAPREMFFQQQQTQIK
jgi:hypothetical protein